MIYTRRTFSYFYLEIACCRQFGVFCIAEYDWSIKNKKLAKTGVHTAFFLWANEARHGFSSVGMRYRGSATIPLVIHVELAAPAGENGAKGSPALWVEHGRREQWIFLSAIKHMFRTEQVYMSIIKVNESDSFSSFNLEKSGKLPCLAHLAKSARSFYIQSTY